MSEDKFKVDTCFWRDLEAILNQRAREGWLSAYIHSQQAPPDNEAWFVLTWYRPAPGCGIPIGFKVI